MHECGEIARYASSYHDTLIYNLLSCPFAIRFRRLDFVGRQDVAPKPGRTPEQTNNLGI